MDPNNFYTCLYDYSKARNDIELINKVLGKPYEAPLRLDPTTAAKVSDSINDFIKSNRHLLNRSHLPQLRELSALVPGIEVKSGRTGTEGATALETTIDSTIRFLQNMPEKTTPAST